jgi:hypothetical protein
MKLRKVDWIFIVGALGVVVGVSLLPTPKDRNPMIPRTSEHETVRMEKDCVACHAVDAVRPLPPRHPKRPDCFRCHARSVSSDGGKTSVVNGIGQWSRLNRQGIGGWQPPLTDHAGPAFNGGTKPDKQRRA